MEILNFENKKMKLLTKEQQESYENAKICYICKQKFENKYVKDKKIVKLEIIVFTLLGEYIRAAHSISNLKYGIPKKIPIAFHNGYNYNYHFIIKDWGQEFEKQVTCLGENNEKYITFSVLIEKEVTRIDKKWRKNYKKFILQTTVSW